MMNYFFYKDYMFNKMIKHSEPLLVSAIMISIIEFSNGLSVFFVLNKYLFHLKFSSLSTIVSYIVTGIILQIANTIYYTKNEEKISAKFKGESKRRNILGYILYALYLIGSIGLVLLLIIKGF